MTMYYRYCKKEKEKEGDTAKKTKSKGWKDWTDEEISLLIDMLEEKPCYFVIVIYILGIIQ